MNRTLATALVWMGLAATAVAQTGSAPKATTQTAAVAEDAEHEALRQLRAVYEQAVRNGGPTDLAPLLGTEFYGVMVTGRAVRSMDDLTRYWTDIRALIGEGGHYTTSLNPERSVIIGDVALARGTSDDVVVTGAGREFRFTTLWTAVLQKSGGQWRLRQMQGSIDPVDNPFVRELVKKAVLPSAGICLLAGAVLGWGIAALIGRRRARKIA